MSPPACGSMFQLRFHSDLQRRSPSGHNTLFERGVWSRVGGGGPETQQGEGRRRTGAERDRWMEKAKREEDCEGGTDGATER